MELTKSQRESRWVMQETWVCLLGQKDPLEKRMATHSSILAWRIPWTGEPGRLQSMGSLSTGHEAGGLVLSLGQVESEQPLGLSSRVVQKII